MNYTLATVTQGKRAAKETLLGKFGADTVDEELLARPLLGMVGRLVTQKGIDLILDTLPEILADSPACFAFLGTGDAQFEQQLQLAARMHPRRVFVEIGFSESMAHLVEAGSDIFLMPSRFEPCGLNQMYSLRYGTPPIVHNTGGLADTVVRTNAETLADNTANGFVFDSPDTSSFRNTVMTALAMFNDRKNLVQYCRQWHVPRIWPGTAVQDNT